MVCVDVFEGPIKHQAARCAIAVVILLLGDVIYLFLIGGLNKLYSNKMAFLNTWITVKLFLMPAKT